ncbi:Toll/interleukin-1 receptor domain-containing protein [Tanacetum coccineum]
MVSSSTSSLQNSFKHDALPTQTQNTFSKASTILPTISLQSCIEYIQNRLRLSDRSSITSLASTSSSSIHKRFKYDVFLSFRGEDTRKNFVDHLYHALKDKGICTYKDDEKIQKGKRIKDDLFKSIEDSKFYIIKMTSHTAYPVFYDVEPAKVRKQSGAVGEAFFKHENEEAAGKWREALKEAAYLAGWELNDGYVPSIPALMKRIKGMGGVGKTTTSRAVFDYLSIDFEAKSFVGNVREVSKASIYGLKNLQEQLLSNLLNEQVNQDSVDDGKNMMKRRMWCKKVLLVLDDVDHIEQLKAFGEPKLFKPGSRILITTRDEQVLHYKKKCL